MAACSKFCQRNDAYFPVCRRKVRPYEYDLQPWFKVMPRETFDALERRLGWHMLIVGSPGLAAGFRLQAGFIT